MHRLYANTMSHINKEPEHQEIWVTMGVLEPIPQEYQVVTVFNRMQELDWKPETTQGTLGLQWKSLLLTFIPCSKDFRMTEEGEAVLWITRWSTYLVHYQDDTVMDEPAAPRSHRNGGSLQMTSYITHL
jgi:hypothetical protein